MSAALGAALKKIAVALLSDPKTLKKVAGIVLTLLVAVILPIAAVIAIFSTDFEIDVPEFQRLAIQSLTPEQQANLQHMEDTGNAIQAELTSRGQEKRLKEALVLFVFALGDFSHYPSTAADFPVEPFNSVVSTGCGTCVRRGSRSRSKFRQCHLPLS